MNLQDNIEYSKKKFPSKVTRTGIFLLSLGIIIIFTAYFTNPVRSAFNNLILLMFLTSIGLGSLFLIAIEYLSGAVWSTPFRRVSEFLAFS
ncbi:quinol:cytochrome C oxidoreductase, partial [Bacteroidota bacterium]